MGLLSIFPNFFSRLEPGPLPDRARYPQHHYSPEEVEGEAIVIDKIVPGRKGGVRFRGTWWSARCTEAIALAPGTPVHVIGRREITLWVEPMPSPLSSLT